MKPKVIVFDLGKVLVDFDFSLAARKVLARSTRPPEQLQNLLQFSPLLCQFERGEITDRQFFEVVREATGYQDGFDTFASAFADIFTEIPEMTRLHARLRAAGWPTWILSNTNTLAETHIRRAFPFFSQFDGYLFSFTAGVMKPDAKIYEAAERATGCRGPELLFLDDRRENVEAALARGWQGWVQETPEKTWAEFNRRGLLENSASG